MAPFVIPIGADPIAIFVEERAATFGLYLGKAGIAALHRGGRQLVNNDTMPYDNVRIARNADRTAYLDRCASHERPPPQYSREMLRPFSTLPSPEPDPALIPSTRPEPIRSRPPSLAVMPGVEPTSPAGMPEPEPSK